jgi:hypothetical protein
MGIFEVIWLVLLAIGAMVEGVALFNHMDGDTLSENIRDWFHINDERPTASAWVMRIGLLISCLWFIPHIFLNWPW